MNVDIPELDEKGLRSFALQVSAAIVVLFGLFFPWFLEAAFPLWPWVLAAVLTAWGLFAAKTLRPVYNAWMRLGIVLNKFVSPVVLGIVYYVVITPVGLIRRRFATDSMARDFDANAQSYRVSATRHPKEKMERPF